MIPPEKNVTVSTDTIHCRVRRLGVRASKYASGYPIAAASPVTSSESTSVPTNTRCANGEPRIAP